MSMCHIIGFLILALVPVLVLAEILRCAGWRETLRVIFYAGTISALLFRAILMLNK